VPHETIAAAAAVVSAVIALAAMAVTFHQARKHHAQSMKLSQYIAITQRVFDVDMLFVQNPSFRPYFYERRLVDDASNLQQVTAIAEYILDFYSTVQEHERLLASQETPSWEEWRAFIADGFRWSPFLCAFFEQNAAWYEEGLMSIYRPVAKDHQELIARQRKALARSDA
jgi:hypothetical protein